MQSLVLIARRGHDESSPAGLAAGQARDRQAQTADDKRGRMNGQSAPLIEDSNHAQSP